MQTNLLKEEEINISRLFKVFAFLSIASVVLAACGSQATQAPTTQAPATQPAVATQPPTTLGALYDNYINSPITNPPADVVKSGHRAVDVGDATELFDQVWTEVKGGQ